MYGFSPHPIIPYLPTYNQKRQAEQQKKSASWWSFVISLLVVGAVVVATWGVGAIVEALIGTGMVSTIASDLTVGVGFSIFSAVKGDKNISTYVLNFVFPIADVAVVYSLRLYKYTKIARLFNAVSKTEPFLQSSAKNELVNDLYVLSTAIKRSEISEDFIKQYKYAFRAIEQKYNIKFYNDFYELTLNWEMNVSKYQATNIAFRAMKTSNLEEKKALAELFLENPVYKFLSKSKNAWKIDTKFLTFDANSLNMIAITEMKMNDKRYKFIIHSLAKLDKLLMNLDPFYAFRRLIKKVLFKRWNSLGYERSIKEYIWDTKSLSSLNKYLEDTKTNLKDKFFRKKFLKSKQNYHPFNDSEWIDGVDIRQSLPNFLSSVSNIESQIVDIIVYFKKPKSFNAKWKEPVAIYKLFYVRDVLPFLSAQSKGQYYLKTFAWGWKIGKMLAFFKKFEGVDAVFGRNIFDLVIEAKWVYMDADTVYNLYFKNHAKKLKKQFGKFDKEIERQLIWNFFWMLNLKFLGSPVAGLITENKNMFKQRFLSRTRSIAKINIYKRTRFFARSNNSVYRFKSPKRPFRV